MAHSWPFSFVWEYANAPRPDGSYPGITTTTDDVTESGWYEDWVIPFLNVAIRVQGGTVNQTIRTRHESHYKETKDEVNAGGQPIGGSFGYNPDPEQTTTITEDFFRDATDATTRTNHTVYGPLGSSTTSTFSRDYEKHTGSTTESVQSDPVWDRDYDEYRTDLKLHTNNKTTTGQLHEFEAWYHGPNDYNDGTHTTTDIFETQPAPTPPPAAPTVVPAGRDIAFEAEPPEGDKNHLLTLDLTVYGSLEIPVGLSVAGDASELAIQDAIALAKRYAALTQSINEAKSNLGIWFIHEEPVKKEIDKVEKERSAVAHLFQAMGYDQIPFVWRGSESWLGGEMYVPAARIEISSGIENLVNYVQRPIPYTGAAGFLEPVGGPLEIVAGIGAAKLARVAFALPKKITPVVTDDVGLISAKSATHILLGDATGGGHKFGLLRLFNGKSKFPWNWSEGKILNAVAEVATNPNSKWIQQTGKIGSLVTKAGNPVKFAVEGIYDGVKMRVIVQGNEIITAFPIK